MNDHNVSMLMFLCVFRLILTPKINQECEKPMLSFCNTNKEDKFVKIQSQM